MNEDRISFLYGKNGSGKSTISKAMRRAKGDVVDDIVRAILLGQGDTAFVDTQCIHVLNEDYVSSRDKIQDDGLNAIVLLGELGDLEDKILDLELRIEAESNRNIKFKKTADEYKDRDSKKSPSNCRFQVNLGLSGDGHWAEREKIINNGKRNAGVTDKVIDSIIALCYFFTELIMNQEAKDGYSKKLILVIDDLVSSFDFENKVGIMSLLKAKVADIIKANPESQILLMTHDIQCLYDLQKIGEEVCCEYKRE